MRGFLMTLGALVIAQVLNVGAAMAVDVLRDGELGDSSAPLPVAASPEQPAPENR